MTDEEKGTKSDIRQKKKPESDILFAVTIVCNKKGAAKLLEETDYDGEIFKRADHIPAIDRVITSLAMLNLCQPLIDTIVMDTAKVVLGNLPKVLRDALQDLSRSIMVANQFPTGMPKN